MSKVLKRKIMFLLALSVTYFIAFGHAYTGIDKQDKVSKYSVDDLVPIQVISDSNTYGDGTYVEFVYSEQDSSNNTVTCSSAEDVVEEIVVVETEDTQRLDELGPGSTLDDVINVNSKKIYSFLKERGLSDVKISGVLGHFKKESSLDSTSIEGYYSSGPTKSFADRVTGASKNTLEFGYVGPQKKSILNNYNSATIACINAYSGGINRAGYKAKDGLYYAGLGIGGYTGDNAKCILEVAKSIGEDPLSLEFQLAYESVFNTMLLQDRKKNDDMVTALLSAKLSTPTDASLFMLNFHGFNGTDYKLGTGGYLATDKRASNANNFYRDIVSNPNDWKINREFNDKVGRIISKLTS